MKTSYLFLDIIPDFPLLFSSSLSARVAAFHGVEENEDFWIVFLDLL